MGIEKQDKLFKIIGVVVLAILIILPLYLNIKKNNTFTNAIRPEVIAGHKLDVEIQKTPNVITREFAQTGQRSVSYGNLGSAVVTPARYNINTFGDKDFEVLGEAPWALLNTVSFNIDDPDIVRYVFNNALVAKSFMARPDVKPLVTDPKVLYSTLQNEAALQQFFTFNAVQAALRSPKIIETIAASRIMDSILRAPAAQYLIKNPRTSAAAIAKSPTLTELKNNPAIAKAIRTNKHTSKIAATLLK